MRTFAILLMVTGFAGGTLYPIVAITMALRRAEATQTGTDSLAGGVSVSLGWTAIGLLVGIVGLVLFVVADDHGKCCRA